MPERTNRDGIETQNLLAAACDHLLFRLISFSPLYLLLMVEILLDVALIPSALRRRLLNNTLVLPLEKVLGSTEQQCVDVDISDYYQCRD